MQDESFYISNVSLQNDTLAKTQNLAQGIRGHWSTTSQLVNLSYVTSVSKSLFCVQFLKG